MDPDPASFNFILTSFPEFLTLFGPYILAIMVLLVLSAIISGAEVAFFSLTEAEKEEIREENGRVWELVNRPRKLLATILIFNNLVNVAIILLSSFLLNLLVTTFHWNTQSWFEYVLPIIEVGLITFILLFFGEITPKVYATQNRLTIVQKVALPLLGLRAFLTPLSWLLIKSTGFVDRRITNQSEGASFEDIKHAIDLTSEEASPEEEKTILKGIVNFSSTMVKAVMRARVDMVAIDINQTLHEVIDVINEGGFSRIPAYDDSLDKIEGILYVKDLLPLLKPNAKSENWQTLVRKAYFVPETKKIDDLLEEFKTRRLHIAIVVDEFGGTGGLVTLEDIIEEIFGEIVDEFDEEELGYSKLSETVYIFDGKMPLNDILRIVEVPDDSFDEVRGDADTLAGLILEAHGRIPVIGDEIEFGDFRFVIESVTQRRIKRIKFEFVEPQDDLTPEKSNG